MQDMEQEPIFSEKDLQIIESQVYDPALTPSYESIKACLIWADEIPHGLSLDGYSILEILWIGRSLLHRGLSLADDPINPAHVQSTWTRAQQQGLKWIGFKRLVISDEDRAYYMKAMKDEEEAGCI
jgi:hypothetical protein